MVSSDACAAIGRWHLINKATNVRRFSGNVAVAASDKRLGYEALCWFAHNYRPPNEIFTAQLGSRTGYLKLNLVQA